VSARRLCFLILLNTNQSHFLRLHSTSTSGSGSDSSSSSEVEVRLLDVLILTMIFAIKKRHMLPLQLVQVRLRDGSLGLYRRGIPKRSHVNSSGRELGFAQRKSGSAKQVTWSPDKHVIEHNVSQEMPFQQHPRIQQGQLANVAHSRQDLWLSPGGIPPCAQVDNARRLPLRSSRPKLKPKVRGGLVVGMGPVGLSSHADLDLEEVDPEQGGPRNITCELQRQLAAVLRQSCEAPNHPSPKRLILAQQEQNYDLNAGHRIGNYAAQDSPSFARLEALQWKREGEPRLCEPHWKRRSPGKSEGHHTTCPSSGHRTTKSGSRSESESKPLSRFPSPSLRSTIEHKRRSSSRRNEHDPSISQKHHSKHMEGSLEIANCFQSRWDTLGQAAVEPSSPTGSASSSDSLCMERPYRSNNGAPTAAGEGYRDW
jgi:hypothetical protein